MDTFIQALIISFREGLEAFLIIAILLQFLDKTNNSSFKKYVFKWAIWWILGSLALWLVLFKISSLVGDTDITAKIWESASSFVVVVLITTFIVWMINNWTKIRENIEKKASLNLSKKWIFLISLFMVLREWVEIAIFSFAGKYSIAPVAIGVWLSVVVVFLIFYSILKVRLNTIFSITLVYLILQSWFLIGYGVHEGLSALKEIWILAESNMLYSKAFNLSDTIFYHKEGVLWMPLYVIFGWYSKPEWIQFIIQYFYTFWLLFYWYKRK